ncbi:MAG: hypothetical protein KKA73_07135 [Chloroflexi bacterium]|nr:hypothetical protein [Chloroflexota bacterium]MBU1747444.1 hypothetical protein [Chloroflexota bacterium]
MPENILIATLGDHPAVITAMVKALRETEGLRIDTLHVLHPQDTGKDIAQLGYALIEEHLRDQCAVYPEPLPFGDPNTRETSIMFLQTLASVLERYQDQEQYHVYLSLAGGRKNMSALMALVTQFFPSVKGLYHLIDRLEDSRHPSFPSIAEIVLMSSPKEQDDTLDPPLENLQLVPVPYPGVFADASRLWHILQVGGSLAYTPEVEAFFGPIAARRDPGSMVRVWASERAIQDYQELGDQMQKKFLGYACRMRYPSHLEAKASGPRGWETDCQVYPEHKAHSNLRLFYYWDRQAQVLTICRAMLHEDYDRKGAVWYKDHSRAVPISRLEQECILLVPLGKSPMIATQTYTLLQDGEEEGYPPVSVVAALYPQRHPEICNGVRLLERQFRNRQVGFVQFPIENLRDVDSEAACRIYLEALLATIDGLRRDYPDHQIALSLSGGRKVMSALTLFAAQRVGIERVYHTLIADIELEQRVEAETSIAEIDKLPTDEAKARRLFLDEYGKDQFELFTIPVIPLSQHADPES